MNRDKRNVKILRLLPKTVLVLKCLVNNSISYTSINKMDPPPCVYISLTHKNTSRVTFLKYILR